MEAMGNIETYLVQPKCITLEAQQDPVRVEAPVFTACDVNNTHLLFYNSASIKGAVAYVNLHVIPPISLYCVQQSSLSNRAIQITLLPNTVSF